MAHAQTEPLRDHASAIFDEAVKAADPAHALFRNVATHPFPKPGAGGRTLLVAIGKAAPAMMREALCHVSGDHAALVVTHLENDMDVAGARVMRAAHPVPDTRSLAASEAICALLATTQPTDQVIALISGGGSALAAAPVAGISLAEKAAVNRLLLGSGLDIVQMNMVRQQLSRLKGGGFLTHAAPAPVTAYLLSDVIGDDLRAIASGPTVAPIGTRMMAQKTCMDAGIWQDLPGAVRQHLSQPDATSQALPGHARNYLIGSNGQSLTAAHKAATKAFTSRIVSHDLTMDVAEAAAFITRAYQATEITRPVALLFGGETTVKLRGHGQGGRNQELALRVAQQMAQTGTAHDWVFLSGGTDGRDGPTDAAGGLVDTGTLSRLTKAGLSLDQILAENDSHAGLQAAGDLLITGATGTNVADIQCLLTAPAGSLA